MFNTCKSHVLRGRPEDIGGEGGLTPLFEHSEVKLNTSVFRWFQNLPNRYLSIVPSSLEILIDTSEYGLEILFENFRYDKG